MTQSQAEAKEEDDAPEVMRFKPGQKHQTPSPGSGDRVFYDTLYAQNPESHMAQEWCVAHGTLPEAEADKIHRMICKRKNIVVKSSPSKRPAASKTSNDKARNGVVKKKVKKNNSTVDNGAVVTDTGLDSAGTWEGVGTTTGL